MGGVVWDRSKTLAEGKTSSKEEEFCQQRYEASSYSAIIQMISDVRCAPFSSGPRLGEDLHENMSNLHLDSHDNCLASGWS